ncbi:MAG TPA: carboxypeptidase-like regulatory domain-containing protein [Candidatus Sulfotelmatobacter sp.]|nr:carboxypeptidase-like regulatory domain-containing protein [Candidatus Sulfotelmatobacter sp.]
MKSAIRLFAALLLPVFTFAFFMTLSVPAHAQDVASLTGVVTDASGAVVPDVDVKLVDTKTGASFATKTSSIGAYTFSNVPAGPNYRLTLTKQGFSTVTVPNLYLAVSTIHTENLKMEVGEVSVTVEVKGEGSTVSLDTTDASVGNSVDMKMVHELPIQFRDTPLALAALQPGTASVGAGSHDDPNGSRDGAVTGSRTDQGNVTLDGLDVNDFGTGQAFIAVGNAPVDSIQEFHVETANPLSAEGRGSGAQINLVTKSGTNLWHGSAYDYNRNTSFEANNFFNNRTTPVTPRTQLIRNQFGADLGGPIKKDKLFFFFNYQGRRDHTQDTVERTVPLDTWRNGQIGYINSGGTLTFISNTQSNSANENLKTLDPAGIGLNQPLLTFMNGRYPKANDLSGSVGDGINTGGFRFNAKAGLTENDYVGRVDYNLNSKMKVFGRFSILRELVPDDVNFAAPEQFPGDPITHEIIDHSWAFVLGHTWTISNTKVNQFYYGETRSKLSFPTTFSPTGTSDFNVFGNNGAGAGILSAPFSGQSSQARVIPIPIYRDDFTWTQGKHTWQFGGTFKPIKTDSSITNDFNFVTMGLGGGLPSLPSSARPSDLGAGGSTFWDPAYALALGHFGQVSSNFNNDHNLQPLAQGAPAVRNYRYYEYEAYAQDTWRMRSDLTLTYGLRYQYYSVPYEVNGIEALPSQNYSEFLVPRLTAGLQGNPSLPLVSYNFGGKANHGAPSLYASSPHDFAPRVAFSYNPSAKSGFLSRLFGDRKTVIRGGGGLVYEHPVTNAANFIQDQVSFIFSNSSANASQGNLATDQRFTSLGTILPVIPPSAVSVPFTPFAQGGTAFGTAIGQVDYAIDNHLKTPYSITYTFGFQRELPGNFLWEASYVGRQGRRLITQSDANQVVNFTDPASGHTLASDFAALSLQTRQPGFVPGVSQVTPEPFFENQAGGANCQLFDANCSQLIADFDFGQLNRGDLGDVTQFLQFLASPFGAGLPVGFVGGVGLHPQFATNVYIANQGFSSYNGLLTTLHKRLSHGLQFDLNYTYSHSIDNGSAPTNNVFGSGATQGSGGVLCDTLNLRVCRGNSDFDATHNISGLGIYDLPIGRGRMFGSTMPGWLNQIVGGWQISALASWHTGWAYTTIAQSFPLSFVNNVPGIFNGDTAALKTNVHTDAKGKVQIFADPTAAINSFRGPLGLEAGSRNILRGPHYQNFDFGLGKHFPIKERLQMEFRADAFNALNHANFGLPQAGATDITNSNVFGVITNTADPRTLQLALRLDF